MELAAVNKMFNDCWQLYKKYHNKDLDASWSDFLKDTDAIKNKYRSDFCNDILVQVINEINKVAPNGRTTRN